jgi:hypothetical protein
MSDFTYDNDDFSAVRVATQDLTKAEERATVTSLIGATLFFGYQYLNKKSVSSLWAKSPSTVILSTFLGASMK